MSQLSEMPVLPAHVRRQAVLPSGIQIACHAAVQLLGSIITHLFLPVIDRGSLYNNGQISARPDRDPVTDNFISEDLFIFLLKSQAVILVFSLPFLQLNDQTDGRIMLDTHDAVQGLDIDDADAPKLNKIPGYLRSASHQFLVIALLDLHHIIGYQPVSALDQFQSCFTFADPALADNQHAFPKYINQHPMNGNSRSQLALEEAVHL